MMSGRARGVHIGIEPGADVLRAVAVRSGAAVAAVEVPVSSPDIPRAEAVRRAFAALERQGVRTVSECVAIAPMTAMSHAMLELPPRSSGAPIEELAAVEMTRGAGGGGLELSVFPIRALDRGPSEYFVTAARREDVVGLVDDVAAAGVDVVAVDAPVTALARACASSNCLMVCIESNGLSFHAVQGGVPILSRVSPASGGRVSVSALVTEIDRCADYLATYRADTSIEEVVLAGSVHLIPDAARDIEAQFDVRVREWTMPGVYQAGGHSEAAFALAFGAATWHSAGRAAA